MSDIIRVKGLVKRYAGFTLEGIDFSLPRGAVVGCIGENGAGRVKRLSMREGEKTGGGRGKARGKTGQSGCVRGRRKRVKTCVNASCGIGQQRARSRSREMSKRAGHGARKMSKHAGS